jgi:hypothetical protein
MINNTVGCTLLLTLHNMASSSGSSSQHRSLIVLSLFSISLHSVAVLSPIVHWSERTFALEVKGNGIGWGGGGPIGSRYCAYYKH